MCSGPAWRASCPYSGRPRGSGLLLGLLALLFPSAGAAQRPALGPLTWEEGAPVHRLSHTPAFERAEITAPGGVSVDVWLGLSNIFEQDSSATHVIFMDTERLLTTVTARWGAAPSLEVGARLGLETTGGGVLDGFVHWYHELLDFGQANRDRFPQDAYAQRLTDGGAIEFLDIRRRTFGVEDVQAFGKWRAAVSGDGRSALSLQATVRVPAHGGRIGERSDLALLALARLGVGSWYLHGLLGASTVRGSPELESILRSRSLIFGLAAERSLGASVSAVMQYQITTPMLRGFHNRELDWAASNLVFGVAGLWGPAWTWDVSFQEDIPADTPAIDFTLGVRISRRWPG